MITIDNTSYHYNQETRTIYQYCQTKNIVLPCFCYHERLSIAGNCRMCIVEVNGALAVSCAVPVLDRMHIITTSQRLVHSRETVLEFLLVNHPLDCPICDQGGECDLQDITLVFGMDRGRYYGGKRSVDNLNCFGTLVKTMMTRCIHCTRCVRFLTEYTDTLELGVIGRGNSMEIGTYIEKNIDHELSGNIIDLCPVGALTSMPYSFSARPWELNGVESVDVLDSMAASIRVDVANNAIIRILPILMESINEDWITNKTRYAYDSLNIQRIYLPSIKIDNVNWISSSWANVIQLLICKMMDDKWVNLQAICGNYIDLHTTYNVKKLFNSLGSSNIYHQYGQNYAVSDFAFMYLFNHSMEQLEKLNTIMIINANLRLENPLLNSRIRKNYINNKCTIFGFGNGIGYANYPIIHIGNSTYSLIRYLYGKYYHFSRWMFNSFISINYLLKSHTYHINGAIIIGQQLLYRKDSKGIIQAIMKFTNNIGKHYITRNLYNCAANNLGYISCVELGLHAHTNTNLPNSPTFSYCIATENIPLKNNDNDYIIYQGYQLPENHENIDRVLPTTTVYESVNVYRNILGKLRTTRIAMAAAHTVLTNIQIVQLIHLIKNKIAPNNIINIGNLYDDIYYNSYNYIIFNNIINIPNIKYTINKKIINSIFNRNVNNYYTSDLITRYSKNMSLCANITAHTSFIKKAY